MKIVIRTILIIILGAFTLSSMAERIPLQLVIVGSHSKQVAYVRCKVLDAETHAKYSVVSPNTSYAINEKTDNLYIDYQISKDAVTDTQNPVVIACDLFTGSNQHLDSNHVNGQCEAHPNPRNIDGKIPCRMGNWDPT